MRGLVAGTDRAGVHKSPCVLTEAPPSETLDEHQSHLKARMARELGGMGPLQDLQLG